MTQIQDYDVEYVQHYFQIVELCDNSILQLNAYGSGAKRKTPEFETKIQNSFQLSKSNCNTV